MPDLGPLGTSTVGYLKNGRPIIKNPDGTYSTERTVTMEAGGAFVNIPTIYKGKAVSDQEALDIIRKNKFVDPDTNQPVPSFKSLGEATKAAQQRSAELGQELRGMGY